MKDFWARRSAGVPLATAVALIWSTARRRCRRRRPTRCRPNPSDPKTPVTVSADPLPTVQIDGVAWTQRVIGNTVYVGGRFTTARPAGAAAGHPDHRAGEPAGLRHPHRQPDHDLGADHQRGRALDRAVAGWLPAVHRRQLHHGQRADPEPDRRPEPDDRGSDRLRSSRSRMPPSGPSWPRPTPSTWVVCSGQCRRCRPDPGGRGRGPPTARCCPGRRTPRGAACTPWPCRPNGSQVIIGGAFTTMNGSRNPGLWTGLGQSQHRCARCRSRPTA